MRPWHAPTVCTSAEEPISSRSIAWLTTHALALASPRHTAHIVRYVVVRYVVSAQAHRNSSLARHSQTIRPMQWPEPCVTPHTAQHTPIRVCDGPHCIGIGSPAPCCHSDRVSLPMGCCGSWPTTRLRSFSRLHLPSRGRWLWSLRHRRSWKSQSS